MQDVFVIAEAGVNHNGRLDLALQLVDAAADAGADAVKFQTFRAEAIAARGSPTAEYQRRTAQVDDQLALLKGLEMSPEMHHAVLERAAARGIEFMSTPFDLASARFLVDLGVKRLKVSSGDLTALPLLAELAGFGLPLIVSTGMGSLDEVAAAVDCIARAQGLARADGQRLALLHCTSNYPAQPKDVNLKAMDTMAEAFGLPVGYSDHTPGIEISVAAVARGATIIEKHLTLDNNLPGPDHRASLEPEPFRQMVSAIRAVSSALGDGRKEPQPSEMPMREVARRSVVLSRDIGEGETIPREALELLRPGTGIAPAEIDAVAGRRAARSLAAGSVLQWSDLS